MKIKCTIQNKNGEIVGWEHDWKIIFKKEGSKHFFLFKRWGIFYHEQCKKCGMTADTFLELPCPGCERIMQKIKEKVK